MSTSFNTTNNLSGKSYQYNAGAWANNDNRYNTSYTYDANGNILTLSRHGGADEEGNVEEIDDLVYHYKNGNNQLLYVDDEQMNDLGLKDQNGGNYSYDEIGNLIRDHSEGIQRIKWTVYGKVESVTKNLPTGGVGITAYRYDAAGNRILKTVTTPEGKKETHYVRDASGNIMATYKNSYDVEGNPAVDEDDKVIAVQREFPIYGSSRIGTHQGVHEYYKRTLGYKRYELSNHLGNVLTTITDKKIGVDTNNDQVADYYNADISSISDYYPFGLAMKERSMSEDGYRFGFNGKENDRDLSSGAQDYGMRVHNKAIGRFFSRDPLSSKYSWNSSYAFAENRVIDGFDLDGLEHSWGLGMMLAKEKPEVRKQAAVGQAIIFFSGAAIGADLYFTRGFYTRKFLTSKTMWANLGLQYGVHYTRAAIENDFNFADPKNFVTATTRIDGVGLVTSAYLPSAQFFSHKTFAVAALDGVLDVNFEGGITYAEFLPGGSKSNTDVAIDFSMTLLGAAFGANTRLSSTGKSTRIILGGLFGEGSKKFSDKINSNKFDIYKVKKGDNLYRIGQEHGGISVDSMLQLNPDLEGTVDENGEIQVTIYPEQELRVPTARGRN